LKRSKTFTRFLDDGRICITNNPAERAVRGIAVGRRNWTFCGSDAGRDRAAVLYAPIETAKPCDVDPKAWVADVLARIPGGRLFRKARVGGSARALVARSAGRRDPRHYAMLERPKPG